MFKLSNLSSLQIFQLLRYAALIGIGIGFAKLHLAQTDIGEYETFLMVSGMLSFFWVSGTINSMLANFPKQDELNQRLLLFNTFLILCTGSLLAVLFLQLFSGNILSFLNKNAEGNLMRLTAIYLLLNCPSYINEYILFLKERKTELLSYASIISILSILAALCPVLLGYSLTYSMYGLIALAAIKLVYSLILLNKHSAWKVDVPLIATNLKISLPLILSIFVSGSAEYIDGLIVKAKFNDMFFAIYRYGAKELPVLLIVANTFSSAMIPALSKNLNQGLQEIKAGSAKLMHLFFPLSIALTIFSPVIYRYLFNESFVYSSLIFNIYLLLIIPRVLFPQSILTSLNKTRYLFFSSIIELTINVSLSIWLSTKIGLPGIAAGTFIAYAIDKLFLMAVTFIKLGIKPTAFIDFKTYTIYSVLLLAAFGLSQALLASGFWGV